MCRSRWRRRPCRGHAPEESADPADRRHAEAIQHHADRHLEDGVGPEEGAEQEPEVARRQPELLLELRRGDRNVHPVEIVDQDADAEQDADRPAATSNVGDVTPGEFLPAISGIVRRRIWPSISKAAADRRLRREGIGAAERMRLPRPEQNLYRKRSLSRNHAVLLRLNCAGKLFPARRFDSFVGKFYGAGFMHWKGSRRFGAGGSGVRESAYA